MYKCENICLFYYFFSIKLYWKICLQPSYRWCPFIKLFRSVEKKTTQFFFRSFFRRLFSGYIYPIIINAICVLLNFVFVGHIAIKKTYIICVLLNNLKKYFLYYKNAYVWKMLKKLYLQKKFTKPRKCL